MKATIEGPFAAVQALRQDLTLRASRLKSQVSAQTAAVKLRETPLNPRVISHHESVASVSRKAKPGLPSSDCLSTPQQTPGEAVQSRRSNAKTQNASPRRKVSPERVAVGSLCDTHSDGEEEQRENRTEPAKASRTQALSDRVRSSLSGRNLLPAQEISAERPRVDDISEKRSRPDRISVPEITGENHTDSFYNSSDYLKESDQSKAAAKILQTRRKGVSQSDTVDGDELSLDQEEGSVWVDSYVFRYIKKCDQTEFDRCLKGLDVCVECEGTELTRILLTERKPSKTESRIQEALSDFKFLVKHWQLMLRVHQIDFDTEEKKNKLIEICDDLSFLYKDVLYVPEDSCIKIIGMSIFSHLFCQRVKDTFSKLTDSQNLFPPY
ncbi:uncharacterized protein LOC121963693 [Plectropomus leopardus]|uniref:uncharacterized protein LOC121963693 n=1 Tax=Plectropomus leopardus TaxID=160734 RepID=UPI001C4C8C4A|nr:uncharacterized protein LOC121963693 [Plectropomus leopardus]